MVEIMFHFLHFCAGDNIRQSKLSKDYAFDAPDGNQEMRCNLEEPYTVSAVQHGCNK